LSLFLSYLLETFLMMKQLLQIIREEVQNFYSDWSMGDEPSIADRIYSKNQGIETPEVQRPKILKLSMVLRMTPEEYL